MKQQAQSGFTLVEVIVAMTIGVFILASSYATIMSLAKGSESMINFSEMNGQTRTALELFGRDSRMARDVESATANTVRLERSISGTVYDVVYAYVPTAGTFTRTVYEDDTTTIAGLPDANKTLLFDVDELALTYYTLRHDETVKPISIKHVQLEAKLERKVLNIANTNYIISARFMMRNKDVSN